MKIRLIAFYLPQYHPVAENDMWWGKGFTEWTNVTKARPMFAGHYQPRLPADFGYYDLRLAETREAQANLALEYGIEGFCYWHYWFAGKRLLERPFNDVLASGKPDFPFCLGWANDSWTGIWHGAPGKTLIEQTYPGFDDERSHFYALLEAFRDARYMRADGKPLFFIYKPHLLPDPKRFTDHWRALAEKEGLKGLYLIGNKETQDWSPRENGFDAATPHNPGFTFHYGLKIFQTPNSFVNRIILELTGRSLKERIGNKLAKPIVFNYSDYIKYSGDLNIATDEFPCIVPNWDNTARCGVNGVVLFDSTPELFRKHLKSAINQIVGRDLDKKIIFIKSWNEWAEGNYLEPDQKFGHRYLEVCKSEVF